MPRAEIRVSTKQQHSISFKGEIKQNFVDIKMEGIHKKYIYESIFFFTIENIGFYTIIEDANELYI